MGDTVVDTEARQQIGDLDRRFTALATDYWGPNKDNGFRSLARKTAGRMDDLEAAFKHYKDVEREETCPGIAALREHEKEHEEKMADKVAVKVAEIQAAGGVAVAQVKSRGDRAVQALILAGVFASLFKDEIKAVFTAMFN